MKSKTILVSLIAIFAIVFALNLVVATSDSVDYVEVTDVYMNDIAVFSTSINAAGEVSTTVPVEVYFKALEDASDVKVKVYIEGYRSEISETTDRFHIVDGSSYVKRFSLTLPSSMDLDELTEGLKLVVRISAKGEESLEQEYNIEMQRDLYGLNILSVETAQTVVAGSSFVLDIVVENNGNEELENVYVKASIPELGVERKVYFGDLLPQDECEEDEADEDDCDNEDTVNKRIYLSLPRNALPGIYNVEIEAYNYDASTSAKQKIVVSGAQAGVLPTATTKTIAVGQEATFDVVLVNPNDRMVVYSITPEESTGLIVEIAQPIITVGSDSSETVQIKVKATNSAEEGTHLVTVNVNSESGLVKQVNFTVNVENSVASNSVLILTVVLAIVFVVLLIVLIVLLTKKPAEVEEFGETSYY
tara:strand:+ start:2729 stop:3985 length:1257 start_codon:yes stop_codon:yes gene_type:complete